MSDQLPRPLRSQTVMALLCAPDQQHAALGHRNEGQGSYVVEIHHPPNDRPAFVRVTSTFEVPLREPGQ